MIKLGTNSIGKIFLGSNSIGKAYLGSNLVFQKGSSPTPPGPTPSYELANYIETAGDAWLDTGIVQTTRNIEYALTMQWTGSSVSDFEVFLGYMAASGTTPRSAFAKYSSQWMFGTNVSKLTDVTPDKSVHTFKVRGYTASPYANREYLYIDDGSGIYDTTTSTGIGTNTISYYLGARNRNGSVDSQAHAKFFAFNFKSTNGDHSVIYNEYNFIPVRYNGVFGMWETIGNTFHPSISGTPFTGQITE